MSQWVRGGLFNHYVTWTMNQTLICISPWYDRHSWLDIIIRDQSIFTHVSLSIVNVLMVFVRFCIVCISLQNCLHSPKSQKWKRRLTPTPVCPTSCVPGSHCHVVTSSTLFHGLWTPPLCRDPDKWVAQGRICCHLSCLTTSRTTLRWVQGVKVVGVVWFGCVCFLSEFAKGCFIFVFLWSFDIPLGSVCVSNSDLLLQEKSRLH